MQYMHIHIICATYTLHTSSRLCVRHTHIQFNRISMRFMACRIDTHTPNARLIFCCCNRCGVSYVCFPKCSSVVSQSVRCSGCATCFQFANKIVTTGWNCVEESDYCKRSNELKAMQNSFLWYLYQIYWSKWWI